MTTDRRLADTLQDFDRQMWEIHMVFYGVGALAFYSLLYWARSVPRWLSGFGIAAVAIGLFSSVLFLATTDRGRQQSAHRQGERQDRGDPLHRCVGGGRAESGHAGSAAG